MGVATGCGCKEVYKFPHSTYPYSLVSVLFYSSIPTFCSTYFLLVGCNASIGRAKACSTKATADLYAKSLSRLRLRVACL